MIVSKTIKLRASELTKREWTRLFTKLTFFDDERNEVKAYRLLNGGVELPRGAWALLPDHVTYYDERVMPGREEFEHTITLDYQGPDKSFEGQRRALEAMYREEQGLIIAQPGWGKSQVACVFAAEVGTPTLVLVHTEDILEQWTKYVRETIPDAEVGRIQGSVWQEGDVTIAMVQTIRQDNTRFRRFWADKFGCVIVDEAHHAPAETWELILNSLPARYRFGFTATETRADGMHPLIKHLIGPVIYKQKFEPKVPVKVIPLKSGFYYGYRGHFDWPRLQNELIHDKARNELIVETAMRQLNKGHSVLILSGRIEHLEVLERVLLNKVNRAGVVAILTGKTPRPKRKQYLADFASGKLKCLLSTQLADEALDIPRLSRVFMTYPSKHEGKTQQRLGRALREHADKHDAIIFDVVDDRVGVLRRQWMERKRTYKKLKINVVKTKGGDVQHGTQAQERRNVQNRIRARLARGRVRNRGARKGSR